MMHDNQVKVIRTYHTAKSMDDGTMAKVLVYEYRIGKNGPFTEVFFANEQTPEAINRRLDAHARLLRETGALEPEGA